MIVLWLLCAALQFSCLVGTPFPGMADKKENVFLNKTFKRFADLERKFWASSAVPAIVSFD